MAFRLLLALALVLGAGNPAVAQPAAPAPADAIAAFIDRLRELAIGGDTDGLAALSVSGQNADEFVRAMTPAPTALVIKERDRTPLPGGGQRLLLEIFAARDAEARVFTWQMDVTMAKDRDAADPASWRVARLDRLSFVSGLFKLGLDVARQYDVRNLTLKGADLTLQMATGAAFVATTPDGPTAIVLLGQGRLVFSPPDPSERTQIKIFSGSESLSADFDAVLRIRQMDFATSFPRARQCRGSSRRRMPAANYFDDGI